MGMTWEEIADSRMREINRLRSAVKNLNNEIDHKNNIMFQFVRHIRAQAYDEFRNWTDADNWLFANFDITKEELDEVYFGKEETVCENEPQTEQDDTEQTDDYIQTIGGM